MLLNEFLKEHRKVEELEANCRSSSKSQLHSLRAGAANKVSAQLEASKSARKWSLTIGRWPDRGRALSP